MALTIDVEDESGVRIADANVAVEDANTVSFAVEGVLRLGGDALAPFAGARLTPVEVAFVAGDERVTIDLTGDAGLRLDAVDVGVEMLDDPATDAVEAATDPVGAATNPTDLTDVGRISFTVEGVVEDAPDDAAGRLEAADAAPSAVTFSLEEPIATDGGDADAPVATIELLAVRITVLVDGTIVVTALDADL